MKEIIGLVGFAGSGKDTVGDVLKEYGYQKYSMAKPLKDIVSILFGWERNLIEGSTDESRLWREQPDNWWNEKLNWEEKYGVKFTPRICLQQFGTNVIRNNFNENIWILCMEKYLNDIKDNKIVITDCRFLNEIQSIKEMNGRIIRVKRNEDPIWFKEVERNNNLKDKNHESRYYLKKHNLHESETDWIGIGYTQTIENNKDIMHIRKQIDKIIK